MQKQNKHILAGILMILFNISNFMSGVFAQQDPQFSKYIFDAILINPGYAGNKNMVSTTLTHKQHLLGLDGAPVTQTFSFHSPIQSKYIALGLKVINETLGAEEKLSADAIYAYQLGLGPGKLSIAVEGGIINYKVNWAKLIRTSMEDNAIPLSSNGLILPDVNTGFFYNTEIFFMGVSGYHLTETKIDFTGKNMNAKGHLRRHYLFVTGMVIEPNQNLSFTPSVLVKYVLNTPPQLDAGLTFLIYKVLGIGLSYRYKDAFIGMIRLHAGGFQVGYAYDYRNSSLSVINFASHEIMLNYNIKLPEPVKKKIISPRYYF